MITMHRIWWGPVDGDGASGAAQPPSVKVAETRSFRTVAEAARFVWQVGTLSDAREREGLWTRWSLGTRIMPGWRVDDREDWERIARVAQRYYRFVRYMRHEHNWVDVPNSTVRYADNSVEYRQRNLVTGETRTRELVAPHGDLC